jgi:predicted ATPase/class 3 adenylate cyclase
MEDWPMTVEKVPAPDGVVTFVFTDIEGSTRLFHQLGGAYVGVLDRHNELLRRTWRGNRGYEVSTEGDSFFVAFASARDAVLACAEAVRRLASEPWAGGARVRARVGVHTGLASPRGAGYVSLAVHQAARIMAAAHGGQVLVSQDTVDVLDGTGGLELRRLGRFRLRDFDEPQNLYQLAGGGLVESFPAVRAVPADGHNIARRPTPTVGRDELVMDVAGLLRAGGLVTLLGPGGVGKTRVAEDVGVRVAPAWGDGVWLVNLAAVSDADLVGPAIADAVGAPSKPGGERWDDVIDHLGGRQAVIIIDNCEHLLDACRELIESLEANCPQVAVLATSREPIRVPAEVVWHVEPLEVPEARDLDAEGVLASAAGRLFLSRAVAARPGFEIDASNVDVVGEICRRLDGLPLSIELAAALVAVESPKEILNELDDRFRILRTRDPASTDRHASVEQLLSWSYDSLSDDERMAFRCLSVFSAGFSQQTAAAAIGRRDLDTRDVAPLVWSLVDRSLVETDLTADTTRYRLLETMRSYGRELLDQAGETAEVATGLAAFYLDHLGPWLPPGQAWAGEVAAEVDNLRSLILLLPPDRQEAAQQIACTLGRYHNDAVHTFRDGIAEITRYVESLTEPTATRVSLLTTLAYLYLRADEVETAGRLVNDADTLRAVQGVPEWDEVAVDRARGEIARRSGDLEAAVAIANEALLRPLTDRSRSRMYNLLGTTFGALGDLTSAEEAFTQELALSREVGYDGYIASALGNLAEVALRLGDFEAAARHQRACLDLAVALGSVTVLAFSMIVAARLSGHRRVWDTAVRLHARGERMLEEAGLVLYEDDRRQSDELLARAGEALGTEAFEDAAARGRSMGMAEGVELTRSQLVPTGLHTPG